MALDLSTDYLVIDDPEDVTYQVKTGEGAYSAGASVPYAQWQKLTQEDYAKSPALLQKLSRAVNLWKTLLGSIAPKIGDLITDVNEVNWIVKHVDECDFDASGAQRYRCLCVQQVS